MTSAKRSWTPWDAQTKRTTPGFRDRKLFNNDDHGLNIRSESDVKGPQAIVMENDASWGSCFSPSCKVDWVGGSRGGNWKNMRRWYGRNRGAVLTVMTSETENQPPPPFFPFRATIAPGNKPILACPLGPPRTLRSGINLRGTRTPDAIFRDDSI